MLGSSAPKGICYIETKNLDGETNLKHKTSHKGYAHLAKSDEDVITNFKGWSVECEPPNEFLYKFDGYFEDLNEE